jgi:ribosomal protein S27AE
MRFTKAEALELINNRLRCARCRYLAAGYIVRDYWKVDDDAMSRATKIRDRGEPKYHN